MLLRICVALQFFSLTLSQVGLYKCPSPWMSFEDKCYNFELVQQSLEDAEKQCDVDGASLVSVNTREEHAFVSDWLRSNSPLGLQWYTNGYKEVTGANSEEDRKIVFYWGSKDDEVQGAQYWLSPEDRSKPGNYIIYKFDGAEWGWTLIEDPETPRSFICEISKKESYKILDEERGFDYGLPILDPTMSERGPRFILNPEHVVYEDTEDNPVQFVEFRCEADGYPYPEYTWYRVRQQERIKLDPQTENKLTITNGRLVIHQPQDSIDNGEYLCEAKNVYGSVVSGAATLRFGYLNDFPDTARDAVEVDAHKGIGIDCDSPKHGYNTLSYSWYKDRYTNFIFSDRKPHVFISRDGKLYFSTATKDDQGKYTCVVAVPGVRGGKHSMGIELKVRESSGNVYEPEMVNGFPKVFPSSPLRGDDVYIECIAWGSLPLDYHWERIDGSIPPHAKVLDNNRVLHIPNIQVEHRGEYKCRVTRRNGQSIEGIVPLEIRATPYFPIPLRSQHEDKGVDLTWRCYGKGMPGVQYEWYRNAAPLIIEDLVPEDQERYSISDNVLTIKAVREKDEAMYQCKISNALGIAFSDAQLRTIAFPPTFAKFALQPNQYATKGGETTIICNPESAPKSDKFWFKNNSPLNVGTDETSRIQMLPNGNLHINKVLESDAGRYTCKAINTLGEAESSGNLTILSSTSISYNPLNTQTVRVNSTAFLHCDATFNPALDLTYDWWHNNYHIIFERLRVGSGNIAYFELDLHYRRGTGINRGGIYIHDVQQWHAGDYFCKTKTSSDEQESRSLLQVVGPPSPPAGATGEHVTARSITLSWWPGDDNGAMTQYYIVEGFNILEDVWRRLKTNIPAPHDLEQMVTEEVEGLSPGSQYRFRVRAANEYGEGDPSDQTEQIFTTDEAPPARAPTGLSGGGGKVGELTITWDPLPPADFNGKGLKYRVWWKKSTVAEEDKWESVTLIGGDTNRFVQLVGPRNFYSLYNIKIQAINNAGAGNMSDIETIYSAEEMPKEVPRDVKAVYFNSTAITAYWTPVANTREAMMGVLKGYRVNYWKTNIEDENMAQFRTFEGQTNRGAIIGLAPATFYTVNVQAYNSAGLTAVSQDYTTRTLRKAPMEAPQEVHIRINSNSEIEVTWRGVSTTIEEEPLEGYMIRLWRRGENIYVSDEYDAGKKARRVITDLEINVVYQLRVYGYSRGGVGLQSSPTLEFILGDNCLIVEDSPDKEYIYTCAGAGSLHRSISILTALIISLYNIWHRFL